MAGAMVSRNPLLTAAHGRGYGEQGILTYRRYTHCEFKLKFSALLKAVESKYTENCKN